MIGNKSVFIRKKRMTKKDDWRCLPEYVFYYHNSRLFVNGMLFVGLF